MHRTRLYLLLLLIVVLAGCGRQGEGAGTAAGSGARELPISESYFIFDTLVSVRVYDEGVTPAHFAEIEELLHTIDKQMNRQLEGSELDLVNRQAGKQAVQVSEQTYYVVDTALRYAEASGGKFEPTVGPLVDLWGIGQEGASVPAVGEIDEALSFVDYRQVELDPAARTIKLQSPGMSLDLGAIAKGYAADVIAEYLRSQGFESAIIDLGGNILAMGSKPDGSPWTVGIQDPSENRGEHIGLIRVTDKTIVTSGVYERYFVEDGAAYHHIFDLDTGYPVNNGLLSVTIVTDRSIDADAMSTTIFSLGLEEGLAFVEKRGGTDALFITTEGLVYASSGLADYLEMTDKNYRLVE
jgi:FAD:protein FMN transferase